MKDNRNSLAIDDDCVESTTIDVPFLHYYIASRVSCISVAKWDERFTRLLWVETRYTLPLNSRQT